MMMIIMIIIIIIITSYIIRKSIIQKQNFNSPAGNRTPVSRVTGGDTNHYTTEDADFKFVVCMSRGSRLLTLFVYIEFRTLAVT